VRLEGRPRAIRPHDLLAERTPAGGTSEGFEDPGVMLVDRDGRRLRLRGGGFSAKDPEQVGDDAVPEEAEK